MPKESPLDRIERKLDELLLHLRGDAFPYNAQQERKRAVKIMLEEEARKDLPKRTEKPAKGNK